MTAYLPPSAHFHPGPTVTLDAAAAEWIVQSTQLERLLAARGRDMDRGVHSQVLALLKCSASPSVAASGNESNVAMDGMAEKYSTENKMTVSAAASLCGISTSAIRLAIRERRLAARKDGGVWLLTRESVINYRTRCRTTKGA